MIQEQHPYLSSCLVEERWHPLVSQQTRRMSTGYLESRQRKTTLIYCNTVQKRSGFSFASLKIQSQKGESRGRGDVDMSWKLKRGDLFTENSCLTFLKSSLDDQHAGQHTAGRSTHWEWRSGG
jgi:hypothetical protein